MTQLQCSRCVVGHKWFMLLAFALFVGFRSPVAWAQAQCSASTPTVSQPGSGSECADNLWVVEGTENAGPNPGKVLDYGQIELVGVCYYSYPGCTPSIPASSLTVNEDDPRGTAVIRSISSSGEITVDVTGYDQHATADPTPCKCTDNDPQGYTGVSNDTTPVETTETLYGQC